MKHAASSWLSNRYEFGYQSRTPLTSPAQLMASSPRTHGERRKAPHEIPHDSLPCYLEFVRILAWFCSAADFRQMKKPFSTKGFLARPKRFELLTPRFVV